jgi:hypothetical protein
MHVKIYAPGQIKTSFQWGFYRRLQENLRASPLGIRVAPPGPTLSAPYPALARWANSFRAYGAEVSKHFALAIRETKV